jgi:hydrogenase nickel incorporation protein HypA/HybF
MHEASLMLNLMHRIDEIAKSEGARRIVSVSVWLGALSHMSSEHFGEHFERAAMGTIVEGERLEVIVSDHPGHANAQDLMLKSVAVAI